MKLTPNPLKHVSGQTETCKKHMIGCEGHTYTQPPIHIPCFRCTAHTAPIHTSCFMCFSSTASLYISRFRCFSSTASIHTLCFRCFYEHRLIQTWGYVWQWHTSGVLVISRILVSRILYKELTHRSKEIIRRLPLDSPPQQKTSPQRQLLTNSASHQHSS